MKTNVVMTVAKGCVAQSQSAQENTLERGILAPELWSSPKTGRASVSRCGGIPSFGSCGAPVIAHTLVPRADIRASTG